MKEINIECLNEECSYSDNAPDSSEDFEKLINMEKCPECGKDI